MPTGDWAAGPYRDGLTALPAAFTVVSEHASPTGFRPEDCKQLRDAVTREGEKTLPESKKLSDAWLGYLDGWTKVADACDANDATALSEASQDLTGPLMDGLATAIEAS